MMTEMIYMTEMATEWSPTPSTRINALFLRPLCLVSQTWTASHSSILLFSSLKEMRGFLQDSNPRMFNARDRSFRVSFPLPLVTSRLVKAMLPRNLLSTAARSAARRRLLVAPSHIPRLHPVGVHPTNNVLFIGAAAQFHSSARRHNELPKSPFQTFVDVLKDELRKNREFAENVKQLQGDVDKFQDSEAMKKAKDAYERARVCFYPPTHCFLIRRY